MSREQPPELPDDIPPERVARLLPLFAESEPQPAPLEVNEYLIRHWCETFEDANPLYLDADYARSRSFRGLVAPPASLMTTFAMPFRWPWPPPEGLPRRHVHYDVKEALGLPVGIISRIDMEFHRPVEVGERLSISQRLVSVSPVKQTRLGEGRFWVVERRFWNSDGQLVATEQLTAFGYGHDAAESSDQPPEGGWSPAVEEAIQGGRTGYQPPPRRRLRWQDVYQGQELPSLFMPITFLRCVYAASATRDFSPQHSDPHYATVRSRTRNIFVNTPFQMGMVSRLLTDWAGPEATVRRIALAMRDNICAGDEVRLTGKVSRKYVQDGRHLVDVDVSIMTEHGIASLCEATLELPSD